LDQGQDGTVEYLGGDACRAFVRQHVAIYRRHLGSDALGQADLEFTIAAAAQRAAKARNRRLTDADPRGELGHRQIDHRSRRVRDIGCQLTLRGPQLELYRDDPLKHTKNSVIEAWRRDGIRELYRHDPLKHTKISVIEAWRRDGIRELYRHDPLKHTKISVIEARRRDGIRQL